MRVTEVKYTRRFNMGNYEHEEVTATAVIDDETTTVDAILRLKSEVVSAISGKLPPPPELPPVKEVVKEEPKAKEPAPKVKETPKKAPKPTVKETPKKGPKPTVKYDRDIEEHKEELGNIFEELHPGWNKDKEVLKRCASISREMVGEYIFAEDGEVLDSFKELVISKFTVVDGDL
jgi:hypothetical protein